MQFSAAIFLAVVAFVGAKTIGEVDLCMQEKAKTCQSKCSSELPQNITSQVKCMEKLKQAKMAEMKQCLVSGGIPEDKPCFAFNHTHEKHHGHFGIFGGKHFDHHHKNASASSEVGVKKGGKSSSSEEGAKKHRGAKNATSSSSEEGQKKSGEGHKHHGFGVFKQTKAYKKCMRTCFETDPCTQGCDPMDEATKAAVKSCFKSQMKSDKSEFKTCFQV